MSTVMKSLNCIIYAFAFNTAAINNEVEVKGDIPRFSNKI